MEVLNNYLQFYGIDKETIVLNNRYYGYDILKGMRDMKNFVENGSNVKTKNFLLVVLEKSYLTRLCESKIHEVFTDHQMKHLHFYPFEYLHERIDMEIPDECKGLKNIHNEFDIYGGNRILNTIKKWFVKHNNNNKTLYLYFYT